MKAYNALAAMTQRTTYKGALPYVMPQGIVTFRTFDDPQVAVEAHHRMEVRFNVDANNDQYEG